jgi:hypothetical protein
LKVGEEAVLFWKKEPKNFCQSGDAPGTRRNAASSQSLFASFSSEKEEPASPP